MLTPKIMRSINSLGQGADHIIQNSYARLRKPVLCVSLYKLCSAYSHPKDLSQSLTTMILLGKGRTYQKNSLWFKCKFTLGYSKFRKQLFHMQKMYYE
jgi:hypothetical protein